MTNRDKSSFFSSSICSAKLTAFPRYPHEVQYWISISLATVIPPFFFFFFFFDCKSMYEAPT